MASLNLPIPNPTDLATTGLRQQELMAQIQQMNAQSANQKAETDYRKQLLSMKQSEDEDNQKTQDWAKVYGIAATTEAMKDKYDPAQVGQKAMAMYGPQMHPESQKAFAAIDFGDPIQRALIIGSQQKDTVAAKLSLDTLQALSEGTTLSPAQQAAINKINEEKAKASAKSQKEILPKNVGLSQFRDEEGNTVNGGITFDPKTGEYNTQTINSPTGLSLITKGKGSNQASVSPPSMDQIKNYGQILQRINADIAPDEFSEPDYTPSNAVYEFAQKVNTLVKSGVKEREAIIKAYSDLMQGYTEGKPAQKIMGVDIPGTGQKAGYNPIKTGPAKRILTKNGKSLIVIGKDRDGNIRVKDPETGDEGSVSQ